MATEGTPLVTPYVLTAVRNISATRTARFPVPPSSGGILIDVDFEMAGGGLSANFAGALSPEGDHLEPAIGQIWPR